MNTEPYKFVPMDHGIRYVAMDGTSFTDRREFDKYQFSLHLKKLQAINSFDWTSAFNYVGWAAFFVGGFILGVMC